MFELTEKSIASWFAVLPGDVQRVITDGEPMNCTDARLLLEAIAGQLRSLEGLDETAQAEAVFAVIRQMPATLRQHTAAARALGRAGRLRLVGWMVATPPRAVAINAIRALLCEPAGGDGADDAGTAGGTDGGTDGGTGSGGADAVGLMFIEDIMAYVKAVNAPRLANDAVSAATLKLVTEAAFIVEGGLTMQRGQS